MKTKNIITTSLINSLGVVAYVSIVATIIKNGQSIFGSMYGIFGPFSFLMLFVLSAAICGYLVFGKSVLMYLDGNKKEALKLLGYIIMWLALATAIAILSMLLI